ncbi:3-phosphoshikimate 1-carboxyvinyltransferase [Psychrosphaera ytuae]|uniref:3-phosphoshikimate 1-carboxyvinyltransferase n=1 Tax=Psychrosphaera ytuae TaxID=2820710 RepID=A0A975DBR3_9GAMM|nr:3-phosphoshikimate 1-carboxyvinyltransferase [Psychrosphaera ytuae]QTH64235.1 3-phosphoshikimate 1-carboxyvinyltransferase [Psychrosphaera ytuae]
MSESLTLSQKTICSGKVTVPGSKSLSNRALLLAALCEGTTKITNLLDSDDIRHMLTALEQLGVKTELNEDKTECIVHGVGGSFKSPNQELFLGNAGTAMRPLAAVLAFSQVNATLTGEPRMYERPIGHLIDALIPFADNVTYLAEEGYPPLKIRPYAGTKQDRIEFNIDGSVSSQFLSALLMAAPLLNSPVKINVIGELVSKPYINLTLSILASFGVQITNNDFQSFELTGTEQYKSPKTFMVEGDASSASYFLAAGAITGGPIEVFGIGKNSVQGDIQFAEVLAAMGAEVEYFDDHLTVSSNGQLKGIDMDMNHIPDAAMTIATTALFAEGTTKIRNIYNWRVKETDRLAAMATELKKYGAKVVEGHDFIEVTPDKERQVAIDTYDDHRVAMCFSLLSFKPSGITINDPKVTSKTFPDYFERFNSVTN